MIQVATIKDIKPLFSIEQEVFKQEVFALSLNSFRYNLKRNTIFKLEIDKKIVGYCLWLKRKEYYRLYSFAILQEFQGRGFASQLLEFSINNLNKSKFELEVRVSNKNAIKLYEKFGFKIVKTLENYYENEDGYKMVRV
ncbi:GNAT family N-acetyltransferase [Malaciobacter mytili]|uniref:GNAT family N-acetyltransferase n=1 Tax=Malaciobacter mytili TaxID=603050 RepID=UPI003BB0C905